MAGKKSTEPHADRIRRLLLRHLRRAGAGGLTRSTAIGCLGGIPPRAAIEAALDQLVTDGRVQRTPIELARYVRAGLSRVPRRLIVYIYVDVDVTESQETSHDPA